MRENIYKNVKEMTYRELLEAISNIKDKMNNVTDQSLIERHSDYYNMLVQELDNRQRDYCS